MKVKVELHTYRDRPGTVYATARLAEPYTLENGEVMPVGDLITSATIDYILDTYDKRGIEIVNAQSILTQLHKAGNEFKYC